MKIQVGTSGFHFELCCSAKVWGSRSAASSPSAKACLDWHEKRIPCGMPCVWACAWPVHWFQGGSPHPSLLATCSGCHRVPAGLVSCTNLGFGKHADRVMERSLSQYALRWGAGEPPPPPASYQPLNTRWPPSHGDPPFPLS